MTNYEATNDEFQQHLTGAAETESLETTKRYDTWYRSLRNTLGGFAAASAASVPYSLLIEHNIEHARSGAMMAAFLAVGAGAVEMQRQTDTVDKVNQTELTEGQRHEDAAAADSSALPSEGETLVKHHGQVRRNVDVDRVEERFRS